MVDEINIKLLENASLEIVNSKDDFLDYYGDQKIVNLLRFDINNNLNENDVNKLKNLVGKKFSLSKYGIEEVDKVFSYENQLYYITFNEPSEELYLEAFKLYCEKVNKFNREIENNEREFMSIFDRNIMTVHGGIYYNFIENPFVQNFFFKHGYIALADNHDSEDYESFEKLEENQLALFNYNGYQLYFPDFEDNYYDSTEIYQSLNTKNGNKEFINLYNKHYNRIITKILNNILNEEK